MGPSHRHLNSSHAGRKVQIRRVRARTLPKTASYIFLLSISRQGRRRGWKPWRAESAGTKTRVETLAACLARGLSGDGRRSLSNSPQFDCSAPCFHFTSTQHRVRYAVPRRDPRGGARRGRVPVRAIRARARVRDVAGEPALHPPCVSRPHEPTPARFDVFNPKRRVLVGSTHLPRVFRTAPDVPFEIPLQTQTSRPPACWRTRRS